MNIKRSRGMKLKCMKSWMGMGMGMDWLAGPDGPWLGYVCMYHIIWDG